MTAKRERKRCGLVPAIFFLIALSAGTANTLLAKVLFQMQAPDGRYFQKPLFQTLLMFGAEAACLFVYGVQCVLECWQQWRARQQPYTGSSGERVGLTAGTAAPAPRPPVTWRTILLLALPALSDCFASVLLKLGLLFVTSSVYQLMCCLRIIFVAINKQLFLKQKLAKYMWVGIGVNAVAITVISASSILGHSDDAANSGGDDVDGGAGGGAMIGILLIAVSCFVQSLQFVLEEKFMSDIDCAPLLVIGAEGTWGVLMSLLILYPLAGLVPGDDHGSYETLGGAVDIMLSSRSIMAVTGTYFCCVFIFNSFGIYITKLLDALWKALVDNFRPVTVWTIDLVLFYMVSERFGEAWSKYGFVQLAGMLVLFTGTAIYNGSLPCFREGPDDTAIKIRTPKVLSSPAITDFSPLVQARWVNEISPEDALGDVEMSGRPRGYSR